MDAATVPVSLLLLVLLLSLEAECQEFVSAKFQNETEISLDTYLDTGMGYLPNLTELSFCVHFKPFRLAVRIPLLSYWAEGEDNEILISYIHFEQALSVTCCRRLVHEKLPAPILLHTWHHLCLALDLEARTLLLAFDGTFVERRLTVNQTALGEDQRLQVRGGGRLVVGQDIDNEEGGFSLQQVFVGEMAHYQLFRRALFREDVEAFVECMDDIPYQPILSLNDSVMENKGVVMARISAFEVCEKGVNFLVMFPFLVTWDAASALCQKMKGVLSLPQTQEENKMVFDRFQHFSKKCQSNWSALYWLGVKGNVTSSQWIREGDGEVVSWHNAIVGWDKPTKTFQCMAAGDAQFPYHWYSASCSETICTICNNTSPPRVRLRGLCATSHFDSIFYVHGYTNQNPNFEGEVSSRIVWDGDTWVMSSLQYDNAVAKMETRRVNSLPLGLHVWSIQGDKCGNEEETLLMTACGEGEYTCANGDCIEKSRLCDLTLDCADQSDELACDPVEVPRGYTAKLPPPSPTAGPLALRVVINITSIREFSLVEFRIGIDVHYAVTWYDARLAYRNLKEDYRSNKIQKPSPTWRPEMHIRDSTGSVAETFLHHDAMYVERNSEPLPDDRRRSVENAVFSGSTNKLIYEREETLTIMCYYDLRMYPFDDQECSFTLSVQDMSDKFGRFVEEGSGVRFFGRRRLLEYELFRENISIVTRNNVTNVKIQLHFENQYKYYLVNAFAPSLMMVVICLLTLGFDLHDFQDRIMVSLTSLLVLAAFFTQTSQSIPKTSYVKFIDAWYLALICEDFLVIVALVCVEVVRLREEAAGSKLMHVAPFDKLRNNFVATSKAAKMNTFLIVLFPLSLVVILVAFSLLSTL